VWGRPGDLPLQLGRGGRLQVLLVTPAAPAGGGWCLLGLAEEKGERRGLGFRGVWEGGWQSGEDTDVALTQVTV
jgi:hypothetical protein